MELPPPPAVTLDSDYIKSHGADTDRPEHELWRAVLRLAGEDLFAADETIRQNAASFFKSADLLLVMALAGLDRDDAPWLRSRALELASTAQHTPPGPGKRLTFGGETRTLTQWAEVTGISIHALGYRLRRGWSIKETLATPGQKRTATAA